ncbi:MAG: molybdopterin-guanine dinucleotide biosynthesis protein B [Planctomycetota bacterium]|nr:MAG: molybdopterin-guanine dinucleotide biosynthesis protein B [Planctomycetota bacterium]
MVRRIRRSIGPGARESHANQGGGASEMKSDAHACVLAVCGWKNSGKTTLLTEVIPALVRRGLRVAALKHDAHGLSVDHPGKDSDRLYRAGATVSAQGPNEVFIRRHRFDIDELLDLVALLARDHDLVLVEGHKGTPLPKIWLDRPPDTIASTAASTAKGGPSDELPPETTNVLARLPWGDGRAARLLEFIESWLPARWRSRELYGAILIGGRSRRMGRPKHLIETGGATWFERIRSLLSPHVRRVVVLGAGELPATSPPGGETAPSTPIDQDADGVLGADCGSLLRLPDAPDASGPIAGLLAALRWAPHGAWLVCACDLPQLSAPAIEWLCAQRRPGRWAVLPRGESGRVEPLLAVYEPQARTLLAALRHEGIDAPRRLVGYAQVFTPEIPGELLASWCDRDTPAELDELRGQS